MKQINIFGGVDTLKDEHPSIKGKKINSKYYGSELNKFVAEEGRLDMVVNNIDLIFNYYKEGNIRIVESKHTNEKLSKGQEILLKQLTKKGIEVYVVYGDYPYTEALIECMRTSKKVKVVQKNLLEFLNNKMVI